MRAQQDDAYTYKYNRTDKRAQERIHMSVQFDTEDTEWYGYGAAGVLGLGVRGRGFNQPVAAYAAGKGASFSGRGVRRSTAFAMLIGLALLLAALVFSNLFTMSAAAERVNDLTKLVKEQRAAVYALEGELGDAKAKCDIAYLAPQLGMHKETTKDTVYLNVVK